MPVDVRPIHPEVDPTYIGNALLDAVSTFEAERVRERGIHELAAMLDRDLDATMNPARIRRLVAVRADGLHLPPSGFDLQRDCVASSIVRLGGAATLRFGTHQAEEFFLLAQFSNGIVLAEDPDRNVEVLLIRAAKRTVTADRP